MIRTDGRRSHMFDKSDRVSFECRKCYGDDPVAAWDYKLKTLTTLVDESHFGVSMRSCPSCGQRFVHVFAEFVD